MERVIEVTWSRTSDPEPSALIQQPGKARQGKTRRDHKNRAQHCTASTAGARCCQLLLEPPRPPRVTWRTPGEHCSTPRHGSDTGCCCCCMQAGERAAQQSCYTVSWHCRCGSRARPGRRGAGLAAQADATRRRGPYPVLSRFQERLCSAPKVVIDAIPQLESCSQAFRTGPATSP